MTFPLFVYVSDFILSWFLAMYLIRYMFQKSLPKENIVIFVVSTTGQGDTPDCMKVSLDFFKHY